MAVTAALAVATTAAACTDDGGRTEAGDQPDATTDGGPPAEATIDAGPLTVERRWSGPDGAGAAIVALDDDRIVALASTEGWTSADTVVVSDDGGIGWEQVEGPFTGSPGPPSGDWLVGPTAPRLWAAGDAVVASRSTGTEALPLDPNEEPPEPAPGDPRIDQELAISHDGGRTWDPLDLPTPDGTTPVVADVTATDTTVVAVGTIEHPPADGSSAGQLFDDVDAFDAAVWVSDDGGRTFSFVDGIDVEAPGLQVAHRVEPVGSRVVAMGITTEGVAQRCCFPFTADIAWVSDDAGHTWTPTTGEETTGPGARHRFQWTAAGDSLTVGIPPGAIELPAGTTEWTAVDPSGVVPAARAHVVDPGDEDSPATWVIDSACDCEIAHAGTLADLTDLVGGAPGPELPFHDCRDTSVRGSTSVEAPVALDGATAAVAWCNDQDRAVLSVAWTDGGAWDTRRLRDLAPDGAGDVAVEGTGLDLGDEEVWVATDDAVLVLGTGVPADSPDDELSMGMPLPAGPLVVLRITAAA